MIEIKLEVDGEVQMSRKLSRFGESIKNMKPLLKMIKKDFVEITKKQFRSQGRYGSGGWQSLYPSYADWKAKHVGSKPILQRSGRMFASLIGQTGETIERMTNTELEMGTMVPYAIYHQSILPRTKLPRRPVIELTEADKTRWAKMAHQYALTSSRKAGLN